MSESTPATIGVLFVCLGNICRSPLAEAAFLRAAQQRGVEDRYRVDSCGTGDWHAGELADHRSRAVAARHGLELTHRARVIVPEIDFPRRPSDRPSALPLSMPFDWFIGMDRQNVKRLLSLGAPPHRVRLLRSFDAALAGKPEAELEVPDPYTEPDEAFDRVFEMVSKASDGLLDYLRSIR